MPQNDQARRASVAVIGGGISGLSCAWLLAQSRDVTVYEAEPRLGGHSDTVEWQGAGVDNGFIVYNERTYPNLTALFAHLGVATRASDMSFAFSLDGGEFEYSGGNLMGLAAQPSNLLKPSYWKLIAEILRFFRQAHADSHREISGSLGAYLDAGGYSADFRQRYLHPMAAAIWSTPALDVAAHPAQAFLRFNRNHGLLDLTNRPIWRTVAGGSQAYVRRFAEALGPNSVHVGNPVSAVTRTPDGVLVTDAAGEQRRYDDVVLAVHADQALRLVDQPTALEHELLSCFAYQANVAVMHTDVRAMPRRRAAWASWNYLAESGTGRRLPAVSYWMNRLQGLEHLPDVFVTLNPGPALDDARVIRRHTYRHPLFTEATLAAQQRLWEIQGQGLQGQGLQGQGLQGKGGLWYCGAWFGAGFHEDGCQAGLAVAEAIGGIKRPWRVPDKSGRIFLPAAAVLA